MVLRAEIYECKNGLNCHQTIRGAARKGGDWAQIAKEKLEKIYGYSSNILAGRFSQLCCNLWIKLESDLVHSYRLFDCQLSPFLSSV